MKTITFLIIVLYLSLGYSQISENKRKENHSNLGLITTNQLPDEILKSKTLTIKYRNREGSPYISNYSGIKNNLPIGKIYDDKMNHIGTAFVLYNAYSDDMEISFFDDGVNYYYINKKAEFIYIILRNKKYRAYEYDNKLGFFIILSEDDTKECTLLKKEKIIFLKEVKPNNSFVTGTPASFRKIKDTYYLKLRTTISKIPKNKKAFYLLFNEKAESVKEHIKLNNLKITSENDLLSIVDYFNSLND